MMKCVCAVVAVAGEPFCCVLGTPAKMLFWLVRGRYGKCVVPADECHRWMAGGYGERIDKNRRTGYLCECLIIILL